MTQENKQQFPESNVDVQELHELVSRKLAVLKRQLLVVIGFAFCGLVAFNVIVYREYADKIRGIENDLRSLRISTSANHPALDPVKDDIGPQNQVMNPSRRAKLTR